MIDYYTVNGKPTSFSFTKQVSYSRELSKFSKLPNGIYIQWVSCSSPLLKLTAMGRKHNPPS